MQNKNSILDNASALIGAISFIERLSTYCYYLRSFLPKAGVTGESVNGPILGPDLDGLLDGAVQVIASLQGIWKDEISEMEV